MAVRVSCMYGHTYFKISFSFPGMVLPLLALFMLLKCFEDEDDDDDDGDEGEGEVTELVRKKQNLGSRNLGS